MINELPSLPDPTPMNPRVFVDFDASFTSNGENFNGMSLANLMQPPYMYGVVDRYIKYLPEQSAENVWTHDREYGTSSWADEAYRTITLDSPATGDFLTWLEANAVKQ